MRIDSSTHTRNGVFVITFSVSDIGKVNIETYCQTETRYNQISKNVYSHSILEFELEISDLTNNFILLYLSLLTNNLIFHHISSPLG